jgi:hypothetical protein
MNPRPASLSLLCLLACKDKGTDPAGFAATRAPTAVFPSAELVDDGGFLDIPADLLPVPEGGSPMPVERLIHRAGFSPVQTTVIELDAAVDPASLPGPTGGGSPDSVMIWDLTAGVRIPAFAELDAWPGQDTPLLLVRPLVAMPVGHRVAVVLTSEVLDLDGDSLPSPDWFAALLDGGKVEGVDGEQTRDLLDSLQSLGVDDITLAVDFPIGDGAAATRHLAAQATAPSASRWLDIYDVDAGDDLPAGIWRRLEGRFTVPNALADDVAFVLDDAGLPTDQGEAEASVFVYMPESVRGAAPGSVPVWLFGHGIFGRPDDYFLDEEDADGVIDLANRAGAIVIATTWRGLTYTDLPTAIAVGNDFGRIPELTNKLAQGVANTASLSAWLREGGLADDPELMGLPDRGQLSYYGISLGSIEGAVFLSQQTAITHAVLHVGGSAWSTMLERSSNWPQFELLVSNSVPDPKDRQLLYAASQLFWDEGDPASFVDELAGRSLLWQEAIEDDQVPNLTTELLARSVGATLLDPAATAPAGLATGGAPQSGLTVAQFDPQMPACEAANRPCERSGAHGLPRRWEGTKQQTLRFLDPEDPGVVEHFCGEAVCSADNTGG